MMEPEIVEELSKRELTPLHRALLDHGKSLVQLSSGVMSDYYHAWENADVTYRGKRAADKEDRKAARRDEPVKMAIPLTYSQVETFVTFASAMLSQRDHAFEFEGMNVDGARAARIANALVERDLRKSKWDVVLHQMLTDLGKYGMGVLKTAWEEETEEREVVEDIEPVQNFGIEIEAGQQRTTTQTVTTFQGNKIINVSPFRFYPDPRIPMTRFQEGEFCGCDDEYTWSNLLRFQKSGLAAGVDHVRQFTVGDFNQRHNKNKFVNIGIEKAGRHNRHQTDKIKGSVLITELQLDIVPADFKTIGGLSPLGEDNFPSRFIMWIANDMRVIRFEKMFTPDRRFTYDVAQYNPDQHQMVNEAIASLVDYLQDTITWLINSRIAAVRKTIGNQFIGDPLAINLQDFLDRKVFIRMKPGALGRPIDQVITQVKMNDTTQGHVFDAQSLIQFMQIVTGISENSMGQFSKGRRSASEARQVMQSSIDRLRHHVKLVHSGALQDTADRMVQNLRSGLTEETFVKLRGEPTTEDTAKGMDSFLISKEDLVGNFDLKPLDSTLPDEKAESAAALTELATGMLSNPEAMLQLGVSYDLQTLLDEIARLRGIRNPERFHGQPQQPPQPAQPNGTQPNIDQLIQNGTGTTENIGSSAASAQAVGRI